jgi:predicted HTH transcriptional regulator
MQDFYTKDEYTQKDIEFLMAQKIEESLYLEYKSGAALRSNNKQELAKDVSAFANSDGGVIIYGISETDYYPSEYSFVNGTEITREWLESIIQGNIKRRIPNLKIFPIRFNKNPKLTIFVVQIPPSNIAPHMTSFGRYYKRHNFQSVPMEEYEVRNMYSRIQSTELRISKLKFKVLHSEKEEKKFKLIDYRLYFQIINISNALEQHYKLGSSRNKIHI